MAKYIDVRIRLEDEDDDGYYQIVSAQRTHCDLSQKETSGLGESLTQSDWGNINFLYGMVEVVSDGSTDFKV